MFKNDCSFVKSNSNKKPIASRKKAVVKLLNLFIIEKFYMFIRERLHEMAFHHVISGCQSMFVMSYGGFITA